MLSDTTKNDNFKIQKIFNLLKLLKNMKLLNKFINFKNKNYKIIYKLTLN